MKRTSSSAWVKGQAGMFASQGLDVAQLFRAVELDIQTLDQPDARFDVEKISELWELAVIRSGNLALGMNPELTARYVNFDLVGFAMLSSANLRSGLEQLSRYLALISDAATFEVVPERQNCWLVLGHIGNTRHVPRQRQEYGLLTLLTLCRWIARRKIQALGAEFIFPNPVDVRPYHLGFECSVKFNQPSTRILLDTDDLEDALPSGNASMFALHKGVMEERLASLGNTRTGYRVSAEITRQLHKGEPRRGDVASSLALTDRTLQRRLHAENTSYQQLLDDARCELARKYLAAPAYSLGEVAHQLGFIDQSNFFRACKRWFDLTPGQYRRELGDSGVSEDNAI
jgi:AraC-like DNA-binding protein